MDTKLLESLLYRSEDPSVDYKSEQYVFSRDDVPGEGLSKAEKAKLLEDKKSELLKDMLAMANAWTDGPRYILLGFKENKPAPPTVVGIDPTRLHDDAPFQQFISSKVNAPLQFKYEVQEVQGKSIGIFTIAKQRRPVFAKETYGVVDRHEVYVRRGSSTAIADPAEVAAMGAAESGHRPEADVTLELTSGDDSVVGNTFELRVPVFSETPMPDFVDHPPPRVPFGIQFPTDLMSGRHADIDYWRNLQKYVETRLLAIPLQVRLSNKSAFALTHCELHLAATLNGTSVLLQLGGDEPETPRSHRRIGDLASRIALHGFSGKNAMQISDDAEGEAVATFDRVLPGRTVAAAELVSVLPRASGTVTVACTLFAAELSSPRQFKFEFTVEAKEEPWNLDKLVDLDRRINEKTERG